MKKSLALSLITTSIITISSPLLVISCNNKNEQKEDKKANDTNNKNTIDINTNATNTTNKIKLENLIKITNLGQLVVSNPDELPRHEKIREALLNLNKDILTSEILKDLFIGSIKENKATIYVSKYSKNKNKYLENQKVIVTYKLVVKKDLSELIKITNIGAIALKNNTITNETIFEAIKNFNPDFKALNISQIKIEIIDKNKAKIIANDANLIGEVIVNFSIFANSKHNKLINQYSNEITKLTNIITNLNKYQFDKSLLEPIDTETEISSIEFDNEITKDNIEQKYDEMLDALTKNLQYGIESLKKAIE